ncbi:patatin-like phospholipase family protein [Dyadobacter sp. MSC1_007]|uniref:patatin-like phospholipase family protein n=1 Tax=Dyadobacter sp. MSC1_007 TaxID=2909264 RepID=UPI00202E171D|nr:patatin-like phospholipase family protein [Dyadobacter sp. MSC1_007]
MLKSHKLAELSETLKNYPDWKSLKWERLVIENLTPHQKEKIRDLVWHSPTKEVSQEKLLEDQYFKVIYNLLGWLSKHLSFDESKTFKVGGFDFPSHWQNEDHVLFRPPFFWRQYIRTVLYKFGENRISLAKALKYMPLQVVQVADKKVDQSSSIRARQRQSSGEIHNNLPSLAKSLRRLSSEAVQELKKTREDPYTIRLRQYYLPEGPDDSDYELLSMKDQQMHTSWWTKDVLGEVEILITNDGKLLDKLKRTEYPLPFETLFRDELIEITSARKARAEEMNVASGGKQTKGDASSGATSDGAVFDPLEKAKSMRLMGLALSGGGIRSATFNLGILQRLANLDALHHFDYISTVSGGGYVGTFFNSWVKRTGSFSKITDRLNPGKCSDPLADEVRPIRWLRMFSNYLTPNVGIMSPDAWAAGMTWLRNALVNQFVLLLILVTVLSLISDMFLFWKWVKDQVTVLPPLTWGWALSISFVMLFVGALAVAEAMRTFYKQNDQTFKKIRRLRLFESRKLDWSWINWFGMAIPDLILGWGTLCALAISTYFAANEHPGSEGNIRLHILLAVGSSTLLSLILLAWRGNYHKRLDLLALGRNNVVGVKKGTNAIAGYDKWPTRIAIVASSVIAAAIFAFLLDMFWEKMPPMYNWLCCLYGLDSEKMALVTGLPIILEIFSLTVVVRMALMGNLFPDHRREWWGMLGGNVHRVAALWVLVSFASLIMPELWKSIHLWDKLGDLVVTIWGSWIAIVGWGVKKAYESTDESQKNGKLTKTLVTIIPFIFMIGFLLIGSWLMAWVKSLGWLSDKSADLVANLEATGALIVVTWVFSWRVGVNEFSLHHFYRNRLIRAYMGATRTREDRVKTQNSFTGFDTNDDILFSAMTVEDGYFGPFPLINTTLNSTVVFALDRQDRKAESFVFTPLYCGYDFSPTRASTYNIDQIYEYGFRPTEQFSNENGGPTMGTAMAISGAAFNPQQGHNTSALLAFLLTIFNVRLGWWVGNTRLKMWKRPEPWHGMIYLLRDLMGRTDINKNYVCLSDGGHFDNMGLYELVRRRCSYILLGDGEQDREGTCEGLANAIRRCRIDFGVEIIIDLTPIMKKEKDKNSRHLVKGEICYPGIKEKGTLIYIKTSLTGDEPVDIREYALVNTEFPQQSTADQFFDEAQFESYRKLGYHSIKSRQDLGL